MRISVFDSKELQAVLLALRGFDRELKKVIRQQTKQFAQPEWQKAVTENASTRLEQRVLAQTARVQVSDQNVMLRSGNIGRSLSGGLKPSEKWYAAEFGGDQNKLETYEATSRKGTRYTVTRHTSRQLRPRNPKGYVVYQAAAAIIPRIAALWTQTVVREFHETIEGKK